jgi:hypothetical protein
MRDFLDSVIVWELIFLLWMTFTLTNRLIDFTGDGPLLPNFEQLFPVPSGEEK